jgi:hypothetical protein
MLLASLLIPLFLAGGSAARADFSAEVTRSGTGHDSTVRLAINDTEILALRQSADNRAVLVKIAAFISRAAHSSSESVVPAESIAIADGMLVLSFDGKNEYRIPLTEVVFPVAAQKDLPRKINARFDLALKRPGLGVSPPALTVPVGETRSAQLAGVFGSTIEVLNPYPDAVSVIVSGDVVTLEGIAEGSGTVVLRRGMSEVALKFTVQFLAAYFPENVTVELAGPMPSSEELKEVVRAQLLGVSTVAPEASVDFLGLERTRGNARNLNARVVAQAPNRIKVGREIPVEVVSGPDYVEPSNVVLFSNEPERVHGPGMLYQSNLLAGEKARLVYHHQNRSGRTLNFRVLLVNLSNLPQKIMWRSGCAGPDISTYLVGSVAAERYLLKLAGGQATYLTLSRHAIACVSESKLPANQSVSGLMDLHLLSGSEVGVMVLAEEANAGGYALNSRNPLLYGGTPPRYEPAEFKQHHMYDLDGNWLFLRVGKGEMRDRSGKALIGDYGMLMEHVVTLMNSEARSRRVTLTFDATAGDAQGAFLINGRLVKTPIVRPRNPYTLHVFRLGPYEKREVSVMTIPAGGSHFPASLVFASED